MSKLIIATRGSALALWQAHYVRDQLRLQDPDLEIELNIIKTQGDKIVDRSLAKIGGKGLFVKEIEQALADGAADIAVHSMKDVPMEVHPALPLIASPPRAQPWDAFCSGGPTTLAQLPQGAVVGTSSLRRGGQLLRLRPDLKIKFLRGNVPTRLGKADSDQYDAVILAAAGMARLGLEKSISELLSLEQCVPAAGQGTLGIQTRADDAETIARVRKCLSDPSAESAAAAERACVRSLAGSCVTPIGAYAEVSAGEISLTARVVAPDGSREVTVSVQGADAEAVGAEAADALRAKGADEILAAIE